MFLLPSLLLGFVLAIVLGGKPSRLVELRLRLSWAVWLALALQVPLFSPLGEQLPEAARGPVHLASYGLLLSFAIANIRVRALVFVLLGLLLNAIVIAANGGRMPVSDGAIDAVGLSPGESSNVSETVDRLAFLGDVFALPSQLPLANVFSVGDLLIGFGMVAFIVLVSAGNAEQSPLSPSRMLAPLRTAAYRRLAAGKLVSHVGDWLTLTALIGWIYGTSGSTVHVAGLLLARLAPPILGGSVAAFVVDRLPKRQLIVGIELSRGLAIAGALAGVVAEQRAGVYAAIACSGALAAISNAAVPALIPSLVPGDQLASANAALGLARDGAMALGAVGGGAVLSLAGAPTALVVDLATFALAVVLFSRLPSARPTPPSAEAEQEHAAGALRYLLGRRTLILLVLSFCAATLATGLTNASLPRFLDSELGFGPGGYGFAIAALATGLALGQGLVGFIRVGPTAGRWIGAGLLVMAGLFVLLGLAEHPPTVLLLIAMIGFVDGTTDVLFDTVIQREADPRRYGAVFGLASAFFTTTMMGAVASAPLVNELLDPNAVIIGASVFLLLAGLIALTGMRAPRLESPSPEPVVEETRIRRMGADISVVTWGTLVPVAEEAAAGLARNGISVEIVDLGNTVDWDPGTVIASVRRTSKVLIAGNGGLDAEVAAMLAEQAFEHLDGPIRRLPAPALNDLEAGLRDLDAY